MEENEDEPKDVREATPVEDDIRKGEMNEAPEDKIRIRKSNSKYGTKKRKKEEGDEDCCDTLKKMRMEKEPTKTTVYVFEKNCMIRKSKTIPRHCLSKKEHLDMLAAPSQKCASQCLKKPVRRKIIPVPPRIVELARPPRNRIRKTIEDRGDILAPELLYNLIKLLETEASLTPEQAAHLFHDRKQQSTKKCKKRRQKIKCTSKEKKEFRKEEENHVSFDPEAVCCQYLMAERFVKSILDWKCPIPINEYRDIAKVILRRLSFLLEYTPTDNGDRKSQQMHFLADVIACWISGVILEVAEEHKKELEEECQKRRKEEEEETETEEEEESEEEKGNTFKPKPDEDESDEGGSEGEKEQSDKNADKSTEIDKDDKKDPEEKITEDMAQTTDKVDLVEKGTEMVGNIGGEEEEAEKQRLEEEVLERQRLEEEAERQRLEEEAERQRLEEEAERQRLEEEAERQRLEEEAERQRLEEEAERQRLEEEAERQRLEEEAQRQRLEEEAERQRLEEEAERQRLEEEAERQRLEKEAERQRLEEEAERQRLEEEAERQRLEDIPTVQDPYPHSVDPEKAKEFAELLQNTQMLRETESIQPGAQVKIFQTDLPFVTFIKIFNTLYSMIEKEEENTGDDIVTNRLHRAIYELFHNAILTENPDLLTASAKDLMDVTAGKIAIRLKKILSSSQVLLLEKHPPQVESDEVRDWSSWLKYTTETAANWTTWLQSIIEESQKIRSDKITRGQWEEWTQKVDENAVLWRLFHLKTMHEAHHNVMMIKDREVVKTGQKIIPDYPKNEVKVVNLK